VTFRIIRVVSYNKPDLQLQKRFTSWKVVKLRGAAYVTKEINKRPEMKHDLFSHFCSTIAKLRVGQSNQAIP